MSSIRQKGDTYFVIVEVAPQSSGMRKQRSVRAGKSLKEAKALKAKLDYEQSQGTYVNTPNMTLSQLLNLWLDSHSLTANKSTTHNSYRQIVNNYVNPAIGQIKLSKLNASTLMNFYAHELKLGGRYGTGLSAKTVLNHHRMLRCALRCAVEWQILAANPADFATPPKAERKEMVTLAPSEAAELLSQLEGSNLYLPAFLALHTGMRRGEVLGLRWADVDLENRLISVSHSLSQVGKQVTLGTPKTKSSRRRITIDEDTVAVLRQVRASQESERELLGSSIADDGYIVTTSPGQHWKPNSFSSSFSARMKRLGFKKVNYHGLRHTHATLLMGSNIHPKVVSERLGHSNISTTLDIYSHVTPNMQREASDTIGSILSA